MTDSPFQTACKAARPAFYIVGGETVTYAVGEDSVSLSALRASESVSTVDPSNVLLRINRVDFIVKASDLVLDEAAVEPSAGAVITDADGREYDVQEGWQYLEATAEWRIPVVEVDDDPVEDG